MKYVHHLLSLSVKDLSKGSLMPMVDRWTGVKFVSIINYIKYMLALCVSMEMGLEFVSFGVFWFVMDDVCEISNGHL